MHFKGQFTFQACDYLPYVPTFVSPRRRELRVNFHPKKNTRVVIFGTLERLNKVVLVRLIWFLVSSV